MSAPRTELDLFSLPPTQTSIEKSQWVEYHPIANISDGGPIEFSISGSGEEYIDLALTQLYVRVKVVNANGTDLAVDAMDAPVNLFLHSLFNQVDVTLNERLISSSTPTYPYRAMIESLLSYGRDAKASHLTSSMYYKDSAGKMDDLTFDENDASGNGGMRKRQQLIKGSRVVDMIGPIHGDIFFQDRHMLNGVDLHSSDSFCLMAAGANPGFKIKFLSVSVFVHKVKVSPAVMLGHAKALEKGTAKCPPAKGPLQDDVRPSRQSFAIRIVIGCVTNEAFNGRYSKNPFNFQH